MADLKLLCLIDGSSTSNVFSIVISPADNVDDLKNRIKTNETPGLEHIAADMLALWRVSVPILDDDDGLPVLLDNLNAKKKLDPETRLSEVFPEQLLEETIHIIVRHPPPESTIPCVLDISRRWGGFTPSVRLPFLRSPFSEPLPVSLLSKHEVLNRRLPDLPYSRYNFLPTSTTTRAYNEKPIQVEEWKEFQPESRSRIHPADREFDPADFRLGSNFIISNEYSLGFALDVNVHYILNGLIKGEERISESYGAVLGQPSRVFSRSAKELWSLVEIKTSLVLSCEDLVEKYRADVRDLAQHRAPQNPVWPHVEQMFVYLLVNGLRYGVLTTYHQTWFMKRDRGTLHISPSIRHDDENPTLLECYMHHMELTRQDHTSPSALPTTLPHPPSESLSDRNDDSSDSSYHRKRRKYRKQDSPGIVTRSMAKMGWIPRILPSGFAVTVGRLNFQEFELQENLGQGRIGRVIQGKWRGESVALKVCDLYKHPEFEDKILTEVAVYEALKDLQGVIIPHIKIAGYTGGIFGIAMEIADSPLDVDTLTDREREEIVDSLSMIHKHGIIHTNIQLDKILVRGDDNGVQFRFIGFAQSRRTSDEYEQRREIIHLKNLLSQTDA